MDPFGSNQSYLELLGLVWSGQVLDLEWDNAVLLGQDLEWGRKVITLWFCPARVPTDQPTTTQI